MTWKGGKGPKLVWDEGNGSILDWKGTKTSVERGNEPQTAGTLNRRKWTKIGVGLKMGGNGPKLGRNGVRNGTMIPG